MLRSLQGITWIVLIAMIIACGGTGSKSPQVAEPRPDAEALVEKRKDSVVVSVAVLLDKYLKSVADADKEYKGKVLEIEVEITESAKDNAITIRSGKDSGTIRCVFGKEWNKELEKAKVGEKKRICGRCAGKDVAVNLIECFFADDLSDLVVAQKAERKRKADEEAEASRKAAEEYDANGLILLKKTVSASSREITGTVVNSRSRKLSYAQIQFNLYDESGAQVGTALANINGLESGSRWNFTASTFGKQFSTYKFSELSGF